MRPPIFKSKNEQVYTILHEAILVGELAPATRLIIDDIASRLSVSAIPVREAIRQLEAEGFVTMEAHVGATITPIYPNLVIEVFTLLEAMEIATSRAACQHMSARDWMTLEEMIRQMDVHAQDRAQWSRDNKALHQFICERAQMPLIQKMMGKTLAHWERLHMHYFRDVFAMRLEKIQEEHRQLLQAFKHRDADEAERIIRQHNRSALNAYLAHIRHDPLAEVNHDDE